MSAKTPERIAKQIYAEATDLERHAFCTLKMGVVDELSVASFGESIERLRSLNDELAEALSVSEGRKDA